MTRVPNVGLQGSGITCQTLWWKLVCDILWAARRHEYHVLGDAAWEVQENDVCEALHSQIIVCV